MRLLALCILFPSCYTPAPPAPVVEPREATAQLDQTIEARQAAHGPGAGHTALGAFVGSWDVVVEGPGGVDGVLVPIATGRADIEWMHGGRFLDWRTLLDVGGVQHGVTGHLGYDMGRAEYQAVWLSDASTGMMLVTGEGDPRARGIFLETPGVPGRTKMQLDGEDAFVIESRGPDASGTVVLLRRATYRRATR